MDWMETISSAISYIEKHITEELTIERIAEYVHISPFYFQRGFSLLCGYTISEYIRNRRLSLAGNELVATDAKVIDIAMKYGYDSPDSFTKAFTRFHGVTPTAVRKDSATVKGFAPLKLKIILEGGFSMDYRIMKKEAFTIIGVSKVISFEDSYKQCPEFWEEYYRTGKGKYICGMYGVGKDEDGKDGQFKYMIADNYDPSRDIPEGFETMVIPSFTWAVFPCKGPMPKAIQEVNSKIYSEWLPVNKEYEIAAGYSIEYYSDVRKYEKGNQSENYYSEIWMPVNKIDVKEE
jgi:AraC family transcriptional regulator